MKERCTQCWNCKFFDYYYTKSYTFFDREKFGFCKKTRKLCDNHETCDLWQYKYEERNIRKDFALKQLPVVLDKLAQLEQILIEEYEDEKREKN